jgi:hypothetical protein
VHLAAATSHVGNCFKSWSQICSFQATLALPKVSHLATPADAQLHTSASTLTLESSGTNTHGASGALDTTLEIGTSTLSTDRFARSGLGDKAPGLAVQRFGGVHFENVSGSGVSPQRSPLQGEDWRSPKNPQEASRRAVQSAPDNRQQSSSGEHLGRLETRGRGLSPTRAQASESNEEAKRRSIVLLDSAIAELLESQKSQGTYSPANHHAGELSVHAKSTTCSQRSRNGRAQSTMILRNNSHALDLDEVEAERLRAAARRRSVSGMHLEPRRSRSASGAPKSSLERDVDELTNFITLGHRPGVGIRKLQ